MGGSWRPNIHGKIRSVTYVTFSLGNSRGGDHLGNLSVNGRIKIVLKLFLEICCECVELSEVAWDRVKFWIQ
jgi:hypothetical protein